jgi:hypothetical protein
MQQLFQTAILALISIVIQVFATGEGLRIGNGVGCLTPCDMRKSFDKLQAMSASTWS